MSRALLCFRGSRAAGVQRIVYISGTSVGNWASVYGHTKVLGEEVARAYAQRHRVNVITLRPRAFIPSWNREVLSVLRRVGEVVLAGSRPYRGCQPGGCTGSGSCWDGAALRTPGADRGRSLRLHRRRFADWDKDGPGATFRKCYAKYYRSGRHHGLDPGRKPEKLDIAETRQWLGYEPHYSLKNLLVELDRLEKRDHPDQRSDRGRKRGQSRFRPNQADQEKRPHD